jgi:hypothetical protein
MRAMRTGRGSQLTIIKTTHIETALKWLMSAITFGQ